MVIIWLLYVIFMLIMPDLLIACEFFEDKYVSQVANKIGNISNGQSCEILTDTLMKVDSLQSTIESLVNNKNSDYEEITDRAVNNIIDEYFESERSIVQVTGLNSNRIFKMKVKRYLKHLGMLSRKYDHIKITFDRDLTRILDIISADDDTAEFQVETWQEFYGYNIDGDVLYSDVTRKLFHIKIVNITSSPVVKIENITAYDTISHKEFTRKIKRFSGGIK